MSQLVLEDWQSHVAIVGWAAKRHASPRVNVDELYSVGLAALWKAATVFDSGRGVPFRQYAKHRVIGEMWLFIRQTLGRRGKRTPVALLGDQDLELRSEDRGPEIIDARDELAALADAPPIQCDFQSDGSCPIFWRGELLPLNGWAERLGMSGPSLAKRIRTWGLEEALARPLSAQETPRTINVNGRTLTIGETAELHGISEYRLRDRLDRGWSVQDALTRPPVTARTVTIDGQTMTLKAASVKHGVPLRTLRKRLDDGISAEDAVSQTRIRRQRAIA